MHLFHPLFNLVVPISLLCICQVLTATASFCQMSALRRPPARAGAPLSNHGATTIVPEPVFFSIAGWVAEEGSHGRIDDARVELHAFSGPLVGQTFTRANGNFSFDKLPPGTYTLVVEALNYEAATQKIDVPFGPTWGIEVELRRLGPALTELNRGSATSLRELSIPQKAQGAFEKGMDLLYKKSDYQGSVKKFQQAIQRYPGYYEAYTQMGVAYGKLKDASASEDAFRKSLELSAGRDLTALCLLAGLLSDSGHFADAERLARQAGDLDPHSWRARSALGNALLGLHRNEEAEANLRAAVMLEPSNPTLRLALANAHIRLRDYSALREDFSAYLRLDPTGQFADKVRTELAAVESVLAPIQAATGR